MFIFFRMTTNLIITLIKFNCISPTLTANIRTGRHNVPIIKYYSGIIKLTPRETFNLQGFPSKFKIPAKISDTRLYKQAGNSVVVTVINRIAAQKKDQKVNLKKNRQELK